MTKPAQTIPVRIRVIVYSTKSNPNQYHYYVDEWGEVPARGREVFVEASVPVPDGQAPSSVTGWPAQAGAVQGQPVA